MLDSLSLKLSEDEIRKRDKAIFDLRCRYKDYQDPWGFDLDTIETTIKMLLPLYLKYFKVRVFGIENIKNKPYMLVGNHTGQLPIDGMLISIAMAYEVSPPRAIHGMVERFMASFPFLGKWSAASGAILGDRDNCLYLMDRGESILVFPEGVRGVSKNTPDYYHLQKFTNGFFRMALMRDIPILPITVIGAEEMYPFVYHAKAIGKALGFPTLPLSPTLLPLPSPIDIYIGEEYAIPKDVSPDAPDKNVRVHVRNIEDIIKKQIKEGLEKRRPFCDPIRKPLSKMLFKKL